MLGREKDYDSNAEKYSNLTCSLTQAYINKTLTDEVTFENVYGHIARNVPFTFRLE